MGLGDSENRRSWCGTKKWYWRTIGKTLVSILENWFTKIPTFQEEMFSSQELIGKRRQHTNVCADCIQGVTEVVVVMRLSREKTWMNWELSLWNVEQRGKPFRKCTKEISREVGRKEGYIAYGSHRQMFWVGVSDHQQYVEFQKGFWKYLYSVSYLKVGLSEPKPH